MSAPLTITAVLRTTRQGQSAEAVSWRREQPHGFLGMTWRGARVWPGVCTPDLCSNSRAFCGIWISSSGYVLSTLLFPTCSKWHIVASEQLLNCGLSAAVSELLTCTCSLAKICARVMRTSCFRTKLRLGEKNVRDKLNANGCTEAFLMSAKVNSLWRLS